MIGMENYINEEGHYLDNSDQKPKVFFRESSYLKGAKDTETNVTRLLMSTEAGE